MREWVFVKHVVNEFWCTLDNCIYYGFQIVRRCLESNAIRSKEE